MGEFVARVFQIILIDIVLSGDNAVVIGMAAHPLPGRQRRAAIVIGGGAAIVLRMALTVVASLLLGFPWLRAIGGVLLLWIAIRLLEQNEAAATRTKVATTLRGAIATILIADFVMSLDNVLGVAAAANGDVLLLVFGLAVSMAIVIVGGGIFAQLIDRLWWLVYLGALVIAWTGVEMFQGDAMVAQLISLPLFGQIAVDLLVSVLVVAIGHWIHRHQLVPRQTGQ